MEFNIIHVVLGKANPERMNGVNKVVNSLASHQWALGIHTTVWGITKNPVHDYPARNYETVLFSDPGKFRLDRNIESALLELKGTKTVFHLHGGFIPQFYKVSNLLAKHGFKYFFTPHGSYNRVALGRSRFSKSLYIKAFENRVIHQARAIHLIGASEVEGTQRVFGNVKHHLIPNGQDAEAITRGIAVRNEIPVFGFVGRLDMHTKGLDRLFYGFAEFLATTGSDAQLWLVGDGPDRAKLEQLARDLSIASSVIFLGAKYGQEKDNIVRQLHYLCLLSRNEGMPGVVLEAASMGVPAIVSPETNLAAYITSNNAGFVAAQADACRISQTLDSAAHALQSEAFSHHSQNARSMIKSQFDWECIAHQHVEAYNA